MIYKRSTHYSLLKTVATHCYTHFWIQKSEVTGHEARHWCSNLDIKIY